MLRSSIDHLRNMPAMMIGGMEVGGTEERRNGGSAFMVFQRCLLSNESYSIRKGILALEDDSIALIMFTSG
jgi:hypothetical protein